MLAVKVFISLQMTIIFNIEKKCVLFPRNDMVIMACETRSHKQETLFEIDEEVFLDGMYIEIFLKIVSCIPKLSNHT